MNMQHGDQIMDTVNTIKIIPLLLCSFSISFSFPTTEPFRVIWQMPSGVWCPGKNINVHFSEILNNSGISWNEEDRWHQGAVSTIFYKSVYGKWPHYEDGEEPPINGGIPQLGNLSAHLDNVRTAIETAIPDPKYSGIACINMEQFRPLWARNWGKKRVYQKKTLELVEEKYSHKKVTEEWKEKQAESEFEHYARKYMEESLVLSRQLRPLAAWGYYNYPYCYNGNPITLHCPKKWLRQGNDEMRWLWEASSGIFPSIYVVESTHSDYDIARFMYGNIEEGRRVAELVGGRPVYVYHKHKWGGPPPIRFYRPVTMFNGLRLAADFGTNGAILWGSSRDFRKHDDCFRSYNFVKEIIAPYARKLVQFTKDCSNEHCNGNGICVHRGTVDEKYVEEVLRTTIEDLEDFRIDERYLCRCYQEFSGDRCSPAVGGEKRLAVFSNFVFTLSIFCAVRNFL